MHHRPGHALPDERQRVLRNALGVDGARQRARELRRVGQVDARRRDPLAEAPDERAATLGVREPVEGQAAEELDQRADGVVLEHHRVLARCELDRLLAGHLGRRARGQRVRVERGDRAPGAGRPARAPALVARDDLHVGVGHAVERAHAGGRGDGGVDGARGPDPEGLQAGGGAALEGDAQGLAGRAGVELGGERIEAVVAGRGRGRRQARVVAGLAGGPRGGARGSPGARGDVAQRLVARRVGLGRAGVALVDAQHRDREVVDLRGLRGARDREAREQRALAHDGGLRLAVGEAQRALGQLERLIPIGHREHLLRRWPVTTVEQWRAVTPHRPARRGSAPARRRGRRP